MRIEIIATSGDIDYDDLYWEMQSKSLKAENLQLRSDNIDLKDRLERQISLGEAQGKGTQAWYRSCQQLRRELDELNGIRCGLLIENCELKARIAHLEMLLCSSSLEIREPMLEETSSGARADELLDSAEEGQS